MENEAKNKTALSTAIHNLKIRILLNKNNNSVRIALQFVLKDLETLLQQEKNDLIESFYDGIDCEGNRDHYNGNVYFNETFEQ